MNTYTTPKIYIADLAAYTNGKLHGVWVSAMAELDDIMDNINTMLATSPECHAEEYAIHDYEGFEGCLLSEYQSIETVRNIAIFLDEYPDIGGEILSHFNNDIKQAQEAVEHYQGCYDSLADYAQATTEDTTSVPNYLRYYIDYEKMARDLEISGEVFTIEHNQRVHVFLVV